MKTIVLFITAMVLLACTYEEDAPDRAPYKVHNKFHHKNRSIDYVD